MDEWFTSQVTILCADETPGDGPRPGTRRRGRWIGLGLIGEALVGLVALSGSEAGDPPSAKDGELTPPIVDRAPEVEDEPIVIWRRGLTSRALVFEHVADLEGAVAAVHRLAGGRLLAAIRSRFAHGRLDPGAVPITRVDWAEGDEAWLSSAIKPLVARS